MTKHNFDKRLRKEAAPGATNTQSGKVEREILKPTSTSILPDNKEDCQL